MSNSKPWTDEDYAFLIEHNDWSAADVADHLGRSVGAIWAKRHRIANNIAEGLIEPWSKDEDALLRNPNYTYLQLAEMLPGRTVLAVKQRRTRLQIPNLGFGKSANHVAGRPLIAKTCRSCGFLLQAKWFGRNNKRHEWAATCMRCANEKLNKSGRRKHQTFTKEKSARSHEFQQKMQALTRESASRHGFPWIESDHAVLSNPDMTTLEKALALGRTYCSIRQQCIKSGYSSLVGLGDPDRDRWIIDNPNAKEYAS